MKKVTLYSTTMCPVCGMVREWLVNMEIPYKEVNIDFNPIALIKLIAQTGRITVPQIKIDDQWVHGYDPVRLTQILHEKL